MDVRQIDLDEWDEALPSSGFEVFHTAPALRVLDRHVDGELRLFGGFKGQQAIGLFPAFVTEKPVGRAVVSPPPSMAISRLGPLVMPNSPKQRKQEKVNGDFTREVLERLDVQSRLTLFRMVCSPEYDDPRPYRWDGFDVEPNFTYRLDLDSASRDDLLTSFSRDLRTDIKEWEDIDVDVTVEGVDAARNVYRIVQERYESQNVSFPLPWAFVRDVLEELPNRSRVYIARGPDGEFLNGLLVLYSNDAAYTWIGGTSVTHEGVSVKKLLEWQIITDVIDDPPVDSVDTFDMNGANTERLCQWKSAFGGQLVPYFTVESGGPTMDVAKKAYRMVVN